jgi:hypothetical protein
MGNAEDVEPRRPLLKLRTIFTTKRDMVKTRSQLVERLWTRPIDVPMNPKERATEEPDDVVEWAGVFVEHRIESEQSLIPSSTPVEVTDRHSYVGQRGKLGHRVPSHFGLQATPLALDHPVLAMDSASAPAIS